MDEEKELISAEDVLCKPKELKVVSGKSR